MLLSSSLLDRARKKSMDGHERISTGKKIPSEKYRPTDLYHGDQTNSEMVKLSLTVKKKRLVEKRNVSVDIEEKYPRGPRA